MVAVNKTLQCPIFKPVEDYSDVLYFIVPVVLLDTLDFDELLTTSKATARKSLDGKFALVSYRTDEKAAVAFNDKPAALALTAAENVKDIAAIRAEVAKEAWTAKEAAIGEVEVVK